MVGVNSARIGVMGESAGGGLAAALALLVRERREYRLIFQHLTYPMLDDRTCTAAVGHPYTGEYVWTMQKNHFGWFSFLGSEPGKSGISPYAAPARAVDLSGLPSTFISTGALNLFMEENIEYGRRLLPCGIAVELHVYPGAIHAFNIVEVADIPLSVRRDSGAWLAMMLE